MSGDWEAEPPVLFNAMKHHAGAVRAFIAEIAAAGEAGLAAMASRLAAVGNRLMDVYTGLMTPRGLSLWVADELRETGRLDAAALGAWLASGGDYATLTHPGDGTAWVLLMGDTGGRFVHLHPGRRSPNTTRVRANVLKTAAAVLAAALVRGGDPMSRGLIDEVRREWLGLPPLGHDVAGGEGLGAVIELLRPG